MNTAKPWLRASLLTQDDIPSRITSMKSDSPDTKNSKSPRGNTEGNPSPASLLDVENFLAKLEGKWFKPDMANLLKLETHLEDSYPSDIDSMPDWAAKLFRELLLPFQENLAVTEIIRAEFITTEQFAKILGSKMAISKGIQAFSMAWKCAHDASKATLTKIAGGHEVIQEMNRLRQVCKKLDKLHKNAVQRVDSMTVDEQGYFWRGYGSGLLSVKSLRDWGENESKTKKIYAYIRAYAVSNWQQIEAQKQDGGWRTIFRDFYKELPEDVEISEDQFRKTLQRAGLKGVGKIGRPKKSGQKSKVVS